MRPGHAPGPLLVVGTGLCGLAFSTEHPLIVGAVLAVALVLVWASGERHRLVLTMALVMGLGVAVLNPFVQAAGDLILFQLPDIPIFDTQVTLEEVVAGVVLGARAAAVTLAIMALLALADPDRLLDLAARLLPRSALAASIAARLVPTLRRDAEALVETARLRGRSPMSGPWRHRATSAGALALPLVGSALDRAVDVAEAMAARGYGGGPRTRRVRPGWDGATRVVLAVGALLCALAIVQMVSSLAAYRFYPTMSAIRGLGAVMVAGLVALTAPVLGWVLRR